MTELNDELNGEIKRLVKDLPWGRSMEIENLIARIYYTGYRDGTLDTKACVDSVFGEGK